MGRKRLEMSNYSNYIIDKKNKKIVGDFDKAYSKFDDLWPNQFKDSLPKHLILKSLLNFNTKETKILDVGCGYGYLVERLANQGFEAYGCDISPEAIKKGKNKFGQKLNIKCADLAINLPYEELYFDVVCCFGVFQYLPSKSKLAFNQIKKVVSKNGNVLISISLPENPIGKEWLPNYSTFLKFFSNYFLIKGTLINYTNLKQNEIINPNNSDLLVWGINK